MVIWRLEYTHRNNVGKTKQVIVQASNRAEALNAVMLSEEQFGELLRCEPYATTGDVICLKDWID